MNENLKKIRDELLIEYIKRAGGLKVYTGTAYEAGFNAAEPHIRRDERERVLGVVFGVQKKFGYGDKDFPEVVTDELKKMDEANND